MQPLDHERSGTSLQRHVSFYFTNFPVHLSHFYLRKGFEVCGILENVYVAKKRNMHGQPYGFVKFSNVRDIAKLEKALNAVSFGQFRVRASVARFDRAAWKVVSLGKNGEKKGTETNTAGTPLREVRTETKLRDGAIAVPEIGPLSGVRVGEVLVPIGDRLENGDCAAACNKMTEPRSKAEDAGTQDKGHRVYLRKYRSAPDDVLWARTGVVATISNGEVIPMVRNRIADAGFTDVDVIHLGADKVFIRSTAGLDVMSMMESAREFFNLIFSHWAGWKDMVTHVQRGAWVRLYGIPLHAWNESFFKLCVLDCGIFLRADSYTVEKDRFDFARVLIATSSLDVVKRVERLLVDDTVVDVQVIEEWGFDMGDDACILLDAKVVEIPPSEPEEDQCVPEANQDVDKVVEDFAEGVVRETDLEVTKSFRNPVFEERLECSGPVLQPVRASYGVSTGSCAVNVKQVADLQSQGRLDANRSTRSAKESGSQRARSCPPRVRRHALSGPWSWD
jgi:hypothetical protein